MNEAITANLEIVFTFDHMDECFLSVESVKVEIIAEGAAGFENGHS